MKGYLASAVLGFVLGLVVVDHFRSPSRQEYRAAMDALDQARDSLNRIPATNVRVDTIFGARDPVIRIVRERVVDTIAVPQTVRDPISDIRYVETTVVETLWVSGDSGFAWDFADTTAAFTLSGVCNANLVDPLLSYTTYALDVKTRAICPRDYRVVVGAGFIGGVPLAYGTFRFGRFSVGPTVGYDERIRWGALMGYRVF